MASEPNSGEKSLAAVLARLRAMRLVGLQSKLILPYLLLTVVLAAVGIFVVTRLTVDSERERFDNTMNEASVVANDGIVQFERVQLEKLRFLVFSEGMAQAVDDQDHEAIQEIMKPIYAASTIDLMTALDLNGQEIITYGVDFPTGTPHVQQGEDYSTLASVQKVINQEADDLGDKFVEIVPMPQGPIVYTAAAVRDANDRMQGVMLAGTYLERVLLDLRKNALAEVVVFDLQGQVLASTLSRSDSEFPRLEDRDWQALKTVTTQTLAGADPSTQQKTRSADLMLNQRPARVVYSAFVVRGEPVGWIAVIRNSEYLVSEAARSRNLLLLVFTVGMLSMIVIGYFLARDIARPLLRLRALTQAVASGDLDQQINLRRNDEIGDLAGSFDTMTGQIKQRTAERDEYLRQVEQRNIELDQMNQKLIATQQQLVQSEKLSSIGQLTAGIVHDVKNPFAVIMGMAEVLAEDEAMDDATKHGLKVIQESARKGNTIVSDLLKFARQSKPEMQHRDLRETVEASIRLTAYYTRRYNLTKEIPAEPVLTTYDAQQIEQVLINMIHNAVQAMPNGGALRIALEQQDSTARISIADSGCGIPADHLRRIFDPFFTTKPEGEGTGLGLSVSHGIVRNHHGQIDVASEVGKGTTFTIVLPVRTPSANLGESST